MPLLAGKGNPAQPENQCSWAGCCRAGSEHTARASFCQELKGGWWRVSKCVCREERLRFKDAKLRRGENRAIGGASPGATILCGQHLQEAGVGAPQASRGPAKEQRGRAHLGPPPLTLSREPFPAVPTWVLTRCREAGEDVRRAGGTGPTRQEAMGQRSGMKTLSTHPAALPGL